MIEAKLFDILGWPVEIVADHSQSQPTATEPGTASFEIVGVDILDDDATIGEKIEIREAVWGSDFDRIREEFLKNPLL